MRDVVVDAHREVVFWRLGGSVVKHSLDHRGGELLGTEPVPAAEHDGVERARQKAARARLGDGGGNFLVEGLAHGAELLRPVEDGDDLRRLRNGRREFSDAERAEHSHFEDAQFFALGVEGPDGLLDRLRAAAHYDDYLFRVRRALVLVGLVCPAGELAELVHLFLDYVGALLVIGIARLPRLEEHVGILRGAADERPVGVERAGADVENLVVVDHLAHDFVGNHVVGVDLVGGSETVEEMEERHAAVEGGGVGDERHVVRLLHAVGAEHRKSRLAARHHVGLVAENREPVARHGARGNVHHEARELAGDLVHVRNHQQEPLRRRESRHQRARLQCAVHGARHAALALELAYGRSSPPDVLFAFYRPLLTIFRHGRRRCDGIYRDGFTHAEGDRSDGFVSVRNHAVFAFHIVLL